MGEGNPNMEGWREAGGRVPGPFPLEGPLLLGRTLLEPFGAKLFTVGKGLSSMLLPVAHRRLLVLGVALPIFGYLGEGEQEAHDQALAQVRGQIGRHVPQGVRLEAQALGGGLASVHTDSVLDWLPRLKTSQGKENLPILGLALVTVFPLEASEAHQWPLGPEWAVNIAVGLEKRLPLLYESLDRLLIHALKHSGTERRLLFTG